MNLGDFLNNMEGFLEEAKKSIELKKVLTDMEINPLQAVSMLKKIIYADVIKENNIPHGIVPDFLDDLDIKAMQYFECIYDEDDEEQDNIMTMLTLLNMADMIYDFGSMNPEFLNSNAKKKEKEENSNKGNNVIDFSKLINDIINGR